MFCEFGVGSEGWGRRHTDSVAEPKSRPTSSARAVGSSISAPNTAPQSISADQPAQVLSHQPSGSFAPSSTRCAHARQASSSASGAEALWVTVALRSLPSSAPAGKKRKQRLSAKSMAAILRPTMSMATAHGERRERLPRLTHCQRQLAEKEPRDTPNELRRS